MSSRSSCLGAFSARRTRNQRLKCECFGYWFPHRKGSGACEHSKTMVYHRSRRMGMDHDEAMLEQAWQAPQKGGDACPF